MSKPKDDKDSDTLSVSDMRSVLKEEIWAVTRAADLRIRDFSELTMAYAAGELTPEQATEKFHEHMDLWGDALSGMIMVQNPSDKQIRARMREELGSFTATHEAEKREKTHRRQSGYSK